MSQEIVSAQKGMKLGWRECAEGFCRLIDGWRPDVGLLSWRDLPDLGGKKVSLKRPRRK